MEKKKNESWVEKSKRLGESARETLVCLQSKMNELKVEREKKAEKESSRRW
jgi:hypothetical protein